MDKSDTRNVVYLDLLEALKVLLQKSDNRF